MSNIIYKLDELINLFSNTYGFETNICDISNLTKLILNTINTTDKYLVEDYLADIDQNGIQIHKNMQSIFCINRFKTITYNSIDPTFRIINTNGTYTIKYTYNNNNYYSMPMASYNIDIISNYAFFHDVIFSYVLKQY
jgi:hypothetical protein